ncbi:hypothetical protein PQR02_34735 [Paraburkholderia sediminicola]
MNDVPTINTAREAESASSENRNAVFRHEVERVGTVWQARSKPLSSGRAIRLYCVRIWDARAMQVNPAEP